MSKREFSFSYEEFDSASALPEADAALLAAAGKAAAYAYAPYSRFYVGAAARLANGVVVTGTNQENAAYPAGICAERTLLSVAGAQYPGVAIETLAISYRSEKGASDRPIAPCGICRQSLQEFEHRTGRPVRVVLGGETGKVIVLENSRLLLPFAFSAKELK